MLAAIPLAERAQEKPWGDSRMCKTMGLPRVSTWFRPGKRGAPEVEHATPGVDQLIDELLFVMFLYVYSLTSAM